MRPLPTLAPRRRSTRALALLAGLAVAAGCSPVGPADEEDPAPPSSTSPSTSAAPTTASSSPAPRSTRAPALDVEVVADGFEHGWDVGFLPDGKALVTERPGRISLVSSLREGAKVTRVEADLEDLFVASEGGLMGMLVHPDFASSREFTTCQTHAEGGNPVDIRLVTWTLSADGSSATRERTLLDGLPLSTGRHSGCRLELDAGGALVVGTGDTAVGSLPQDRTSLGGKTLRLDLETGDPMPDNPFADSDDRNERHVTSYGHRNIQGVALQPGTGRVYTAEHGPSFDDEVNVLVPGGNYGWDPAQGGTVGGYDESVPMTDRKRYPDAVPAIWQSGKTTQAICGAEFLEGEQWGAFDGALVVTALKGAKLLVLTLKDDGSLADVAIPTATNGPYGRLRAARLGPDKALYVTTTNGDDDTLLRITPRT
ncbi:PQQ-dependent sugar dehydrogenase [Phycicoccus endophyticus]|uniref:PQQ-dependent sugar dehydrogenase n=1 Tax=Phycicoccus endophyticus TaxID=1690220 RepID=A0A7G9R1N8_9MICO|nr:PQQ-dependent sugar dehydrogenase [Phycicoccus endophyticus]NHI18696.1 PQQ-dependent sugar dehydrogenase [Phycicoccus endophyticus]QNN49513.1 PQQ-dependent sugar dehydrogenase [Phycicoccus endophyticus]GGL37161.1 glucose dehydrogenase [Phycicoccus endophyticus]